MSILEQKTILNKEPLSWQRIFIPAILFLVLSCTSEQTSEIEVIQSPEFTPVLPPTATNTLIPTQEPTLTSTFTIVSSLTPTEIPTLTPTHTPEPSPTLEPTPTATETSTPTATATETQEPTPTKETIQAPQIEGLRVVEEEGREVYRVVSAENPWGLKENDFVGYFKEDVFWFDEKGEKHQAGGVGLRKEVSEWLLQKAKEEGSNVLCAIPADPLESEGEIIASELYYPEPYNRYDLIFSLPSGSVILSPRASIDQNEYINFKEEFYGTTRIMSEYGPGFYLLVARGGIKEEVANFNVGTRLYTLPEETDIMEIINYMLAHGQCSTHPSFKPNFRLTIYRNANENESFTFDRLLKVENSFVFMLDEETVKATEEF